jgi:predicted 3-demethylubiquinone-9 3-methyltransferase (glyoxalase superfamily)
MSKVTPFLWYAKDADKAAEFYASLIPDSRVDRVTVMPADSPSGPEGAVKIVEFTLGGRPFLAMTAGPLDQFNHSVSFSLECEDQAEVDKYWKALGEGGKYEPCGWLVDRWGLSWQITPKALNEMTRSSDRAAARRATEAMLKMGKIDIATLQAAFDGKQNAA